MFWELELGKGELTSPGVQMQSKDRLPHQMSPFLRKWIPLATSLTWSNKSSATSINKIRTKMKLDTFTPGDTPVLKSWSPKGLQSVAILRYVSQEAEKQKKRIENPGNWCFDRSCSSRKSGAIQMLTAPAVSLFPVFTSFQWCCLLLLLRYRSLTRHCLKGNIFIFCFHGFLLKSNETHSFLRRAFHMLNSLWLRRSN